MEKDTRSGKTTGNGRGRSLSNRGGRSAAGRPSAGRGKSAPAGRPSTRSKSAPSSVKTGTEGKFASRGGYKSGARAVKPAVRAAKPVEKKPVRPETQEFVRLNKFIANSGICSRREADEFIQTGLVTVNGERITELGHKVRYDDDVRFNGERIKGETKVYLVMNKPKDYVTTVSDPHAEKTVMDLIPATRCPQRIYPVGRLDKATTGVLMFTNDGEMTEKLTHPSYGARKIYHVFLDRNLKKEDFDAILKGITLEDGEIHADSLSYVEDEKSQIGIEIHSGRNRIVRRIFEHLGYKVKKLDRVYFAGLTKKALKRGDWRFLTEAEISKLKMGSFE
ncbi:MAG: RNA-binding S4 domain-containing protein [Bacteroidales bacterium]|nr:RNA-binding S4 domain-containing protein [Bacteroidales bacterium]